jgi:hypothetical protein
VLCPVVGLITNGHIFAAMVMVHPIFPQSFRCFHRGLQFQFRTNFTSRLALTLSPSFGKMLRPCIPFFTAVCKPSWHDEHRTKRFHDSSGPPWLLKIMWCTESILLSWQLRHFHLSRCRTYRQSCAYSASDNRSDICWSLLGGVVALLIPISRTLHHFMS